MPPLPGCDSAAILPNSVRIRREDRLIAAVVVACCPVITLVSAVKVRGGALAIAVPPFHFDPGTSDAVHVDSGDGGLMVNAEGAPEEVWRWYRHSRSARPGWIGTKGRVRERRS